MSDERYDADGDVGRFLQSPGRESYLLDVAPEPEATGVGQIQDAPQMLNHQAPVDGFYAPAVDIAQHQAPALGFNAPTIDVELHQAPAVDIEHHQAPVMDLVEHHHVPAFGFQAPTLDVYHHHVPGFGFQAPALDVEHHHAAALGFQAPTVDFEHHQAPAFGFPAPTVDVEHHLAPAFGLQGSAMNVGPHQALLLGFLQAPFMGIEHQQASTFGFQQAPATDIEHNQASAFGFQHADIGHHQALAFGFQSPSNDVQHQQASSYSYGFHVPGMDVAPAVDEHHLSPQMDAGNHQSPAVDEHHEAPVMDFEHHQAPVMEVEPPAVDEDLNENHQVPATDVQPQQMLAPEEANGVPDPTLVQGTGANDSWIDDMLADDGRRVLPPPSPSSHDQSMNDAEEELAALATNVESSDTDGSSDDELDVTPVEDEITYVPFVRGQLDCTRCCMLRAVLHETDRRKLEFVVHGTDQGAFQHAIIDRMSIDADGQFQTNELLYVDLRKHTHESVQNFIANKVEVLRNINRGKLEDSGASAPPSNNLHRELEMSMLRNILIPTPATNGEGAAPESSSQPVRQAEKNTTAPETSVQDSSLPVTQAEENNDAEVRFRPSNNMLGFIPDILESSHVKPHDPESGISVLLYPSMLEKIRESQQARISNLTMEDASKMFDEIKEEIARESDLLSSVAFNRLCRIDDYYRMHSRRINDLNRKFLKLEQTAQRVSTGGLFNVMQKVEMYKQEKADLFAMINMGLEELDESEKDNDDGAAGPSGEANS